MIIVSDGIVGVTDIHVLDSVIQQLRATTVACSFLHVGSAYHPHCADGLVPYQDLLHFIAAATLGSYMPFRPHAVCKFLICIITMSNYLDTFNYINISYVNRYLHME